ncbi:MAG: outer membrane beta-barrel protein [Bacteriovoracia bacterium]
MFLNLGNFSLAAPGEHSAGLGFGQVVLMGDYVKYFDNIIGLNLLYEYEASALFAIHSVIHYSSHTDTTGVNSLAIKGASPNLRINLAFFDKLSVYTMLGLGLYMIDETIGTLSGSGTTLGLNLGAGFDLSLDKHFKFGSALSFHNVFSKTDSSTISDSTPSGLNIGGTFMSLFLNIMYVF